MSEKRHLEVLAPAGDLKTLKTALLAGADAVYFGGETNNSMVTASQTAIVKKDGSVFTLTTKGVIKSSVTVKGIENYTDGDEDDENFAPTSLVASDYILTFDSDGNLIITPEASGNITSSMNALQVSFSKINLAGSRSR
ncbi:MAG: hypothetical protein II177_04985 [Lachnospiraceae bacterium]|nr:hypothetical protein [Lachnospiraceae bacterium]